VYNFVLLFSTLSEAAFWAIFLQADLVTLLADNQNLASVPAYNRRKWANEARWGSNVCFFVLVCE
jgi:hypothetical protein